MNCSFEFCIYLIKQVKDNNENKAINKSPLAGIHTTLKEKSGCIENINVNNSDNNLSYFKNVSK